MLIKKLSICTSMALMSLWLFFAHEALGQNVMKHSKQTLEKYELPSTEKSNNTIIKKQNRKEAIADKQLQAKLADSRCTRATQQPVHGTQNRKKAMGIPVQVKTKTLTIDQQIADVEGKMNAAPANSAEKEHYATILKKLKEK